MRYARVKSCARWGLTGLGLLLAAACLVSARWTVFNMAQFGDAIGLRAGTVFYGWTSDALRNRLSIQHGQPRDLEWHWHHGHRKLPMEWGPGFSSSPSGRAMVTVPLWMLMLPCAIGAGTMWWIHARQVRAGHCRCGYDLSGTTIGSPCPECGRVHTRSQPLDRPTGLSAAAGHLALWMGLYAAAALVCVWQLIPSLVPSAGRAAAALACVSCLTAAAYILDRVKLSDALMDPADREAQPRRFEFLRRFSGRARGLAAALAALAGVAAYLLSPLGPVLVVCGLIGVVVYAGLPRAGRPRVKDLLLVKNGVVAAGITSLTLAVAVLAAADEGTMWHAWEVAAASAGGLAVVGVHLVIRVFADAALCDLDDEESDRRHGTETLATRLRRPRAWMIAALLRGVAAALLVLWMGGEFLPRVTWAVAIVLGTAVLALWRPRKVRDPVDARFAVEAACVAAVLAVAG